MLLLPIAINGTSELVLFLLINSGLITFPTSCFLEVILLIVLMAHCYNVVAGPEGYPVFSESPTPVFVQLFVTIY